MKIEQRSCPGRLGYTTVQINRVGWGAAFLRKHKIENKIRSMKSFFSKKSFLGTMAVAAVCMLGTDRKSTRLNSSHRSQSRMPSSA